METVFIVLILLVAVVISSGISRASPIPIPVPLIQIVVGFFIASVADLGVKLRPELFLFLFLPPLLFLDGWRIPKEGLKRDKWTILALALGLVVATVIGVGFIIYWLIPAMPLAVSFALAAVISPTDPVAVSAIAKRVSVPKRLMHILEGESLLNDASGLVSMRFALDAAMFGLFSVTVIITTFLWTALGGLALGVLTTFVIMKLSSFWTRRFGDEAGANVLVSLLIPFAAYLLAEEAGASGILSAVAAGVAMSFTNDKIKNIAAIRMQRSAVWDTVQFTANGIIFVLLGEQLPQIIASAHLVVQQAGHENPLWLLFYVIVINGTLAIFRFLWVWVSLRFTLARAKKKGLKTTHLGWRLIAATSLAGVRGTVTLAGVLTFPLFLPDNSPFPGRDLAIFLAAGVILLSLVIASISLPYLLNNLELPPEPSHQKEEEKARASASEAAIKAVEQAVHSMGEGRSDADLYTMAASRVMEGYRDRLAALSAEDEEAAVNLHSAEIERQLRIVALKAEREVYYNYGRRHQISEEAVDKFIREVDLLEARFSNS